jgi:hypothetical protein
VALIMPWAICDWSTDCVPYMPKVCQHTHTSPGSAPLRPRHILHTNGQVLLKFFGGKGYRFYVWVDNGVSG